MFTYGLVALKQFCRHDPGTAYVLEIELNADDEKMERAESQGDWLMRAIHGQLLCEREFQSDENLVER